MSGRHGYAVTSLGLWIRPGTVKSKIFNQKKLKQKLEYLEEKISEYLQMMDDNDHEEKPQRHSTKEEISNRIEELKERKEIYEQYLRDIKRRRRDPDFFD